MASIRVPQALAVLEIECRDGAAPSIRCRVSRGGLHCWIHTLTSEQTPPFGPDGVPATELREQVLRYASSFVNEPSLCKKELDLSGEGVPRSLGVMLGDPCAAVAARASAICDDRDLYDPWCAATTVNEEDDSYLALVRLRREGEPGKTVDPDALASEAQGTQYALYFAASSATEELHRLGTVASPGGARVSAEALSPGGEVLAVADYTGRLAALPLPLRRWRVDTVGEMEGEADMHGLTGVKGLVGLDGQLVAVAHATCVRVRNSRHDLAATWGTANAVASAMSFRGGKSLSSAVRSGSSGAEAVKGSQQRGTSFNGSLHGQSAAIEVEELVSLRGPGPAGASQSSTAGEGKERGHTESPISSELDQVEEMKQGLDTRRPQYHRCVVDGVISCLAASQDCKLVAYGLSRGRVRVIDAYNGINTGSFMLFRTAQGSEGVRKGQPKCLPAPVSALSFSPRLSPHTGDGTQNPSLLLAACGEGEHVIWIARWIEKEGTFWDMAVEDAAGATRIHAPAVQGNVLGVAWRPGHFEGKAAGEGKQKSTRWFARVKPMQCTAQDSSDAVLAVVQRRGAVVFQRRGTHWVKAGTACLRAESTSAEAQLSTRGSTAKPGNTKSYRGAAAVVKKSIGQAHVLMRSWREVSLGASPRRMRVGHPADAGMADNVTGDYNDADIAYAVEGDDTTCNMCWCGPDLFASVTCQSVTVWQWTSAEVECVGRNELPHLTDSTARRTLPLPCAYNPGIHCLVVADRECDCVRLYRWQTRDKAAQRWCALWEVQAIPNLGVPPNAPCEVISASESEVAMAWGREDGRVSRLRLGSVGTAPQLWARHLQQAADREQVTVCPPFAGPLMTGEDSARRGPLHLLGRGAATYREARELIALMPEDTGSTLAPDGESGRSALYFQAQAHDKGGLDLQTRLRVLGPALPRTPPHAQRQAVEDLAALLRSRTAVPLDAVSAEDLDNWLLVDVQTRSMYMPQGYRAADGIMPRLPLFPRDRNAQVARVVRVQLLAGRGTSRGSLLSALIARGDDRLFASKAVRGLVAFKWHQFAKAAVLQETSVFVACAITFQVLVWLATRSVNPDTPDSAVESIARGMGLDPELTAQNLCLALGLCATFVAFLTSAPGGSTDLNPRMPDGLRGSVEPWFTHASTLGSGGPSLPRGNGTMDVEIEKGGEEGDEGGMPVRSAGLYQARQFIGVRLTKALNAMWTGTSEAEQRLFPNPNTTVLAASSLVAFLATLSVLVAGSVPHMAYSLSVVTGCISLLIALFRRDVGGVCVQTGVTLCGALLVTDARVAVVWASLGGCVSCTLYLLALQLQEARHTGIIEHVGGSAWNVLDMVWVGGVFASLTLFAINHPTTRVVASMTSLSLCAKMLYYLRAYKGTGALIRLVGQTTWRLRYFMAVVGTLLVGFASAAFILLEDRALRWPREPEDVSTFSSPLRSLISMWRMMLGDFVDVTFEASSNHSIGMSAMLVFVIFTFLVTIVILNLLIAILSEAFSELQERAEEAMRHERAQLVVRIERTLQRDTFGCDWLFLSTGSDFDDAHPLHT